MGNDDASGGDDGVVRVERWIDAAPETVFSFFSDPGRWLSWQGVTAEIDPRPGGIFRMNVRGDGYAAGGFVDQQPRRVARRRRVLGDRLDGQGVVEVGEAHGGRLNLPAPGRRGAGTARNDTPGRGWRRAFSEAAPAAARRDPDTAPAPPRGGARARRRGARPRRPARVPA